LVDCKASSNAIRSFGAVSVEEKGAGGRGRGGSEVREKSGDCVRGLEGGRDPVEVAQIKVKARS